MWRRGKGVRFRGSQVDQVMGGLDAETQAVPLFEKNVSVVEFAPPEDLRPGQVGTLIDEEANTLDVSATIVDLAVRKYLVIEEIPKTWMLGKADWNLRRLPDPGRPPAAVRGEAARLVRGRRPGRALGAAQEVRGTPPEGEGRPLQRHGLAEMVPAAPRQGPSTWTVIGILALSAAIALTIVLAYFTKLGLLGIPLVIGALVLLIGAKRMPARTAKGRR